ncbi:MAG: 5-bromo-4-chloroindolyl phosphate hydrolysis family protein [Streptococcaceae bacterium]|jgi:5-bromo-4-chloroindolyl phosphate hydrolysis protein|nr:5-bromo-4-chloroindolyl phosphate hydrolysis family protein [Streptococcaceae bacterium]
MKQKIKRFLLKLLLFMGMMGIASILYNIFGILLGSGLLLGILTFFFGFLFMKLSTAMKYMFPASLFMGYVGMWTQTSSFLLDGLAIMFFAMLLAYFVLVPKGKKVKTSKAPKITEDKMQHYKNSGLTEAEVNFFRQTMATLQQQIKKWEENVAKNSKLKAIDLRVDGLKAAKALFKEMVQSPNRMNQASEFVYRYVPNMMELTDKYLEVSRHDIKNADTYRMLNEGAVAIEALGKQINEAYTKFVQQEIDALDTEVSIAKKNAKIDNGNSFSDIKIGKQQDLSIPDFSMDVPDYSKYLEKEKVRTNDD